MRIIGGKHKGRILKAPSGRSIRPTSDRTREGIFNILTHSINWEGFDEITVLDVFSGTGALGLEAISRGVSFGVFIDHSASALKYVKANAESLGEGRNILPLKLDATRLFQPPRTSRAPFNLTFIDPPYGTKLSDQALTALCHNGWITVGGLIVVEINRDDKITLPKNLCLIDERIYGLTQVKFLKLQSD